MRKFCESFGSLTVGFLYQDEEKEATVDDIPKGEKIDVSSDTPVSPFLKKN